MSPWALPGATPPPAPAGRASERALVLAPLGRDAAVAAGILAAAGVGALACADLGEVLEGARAGCAMIVATAEAVGQGDVAPLAAWIAGQEPWSDLPVVLMVGRGGAPGSDPETSRLLRALGNVALVERPFRAATLASAARGALRARRRQYEARARLEDLRAGEARLRAIYDAVPVGIVVVEAPSGRVVEGNARVEEVLGHPFRPSPDVTSYGEWVSYHPDGRRVLSEEYPAARVIREGVERAEIESHYQRGDGRRAWVRSTAAPVREGGALTGVVVALSNVDARRRAEEELQRLNAGLEREVERRTADRDRLWRNAQDIHVVLDERGTFRAVNPAFTAILGWEAEEVVGRTVFDFIVPDDEALTGGALARAAREALPVVENRYRHRDGGQRWIAWVAAPAEGLIYASGRHVTAEREAAAALHLAESRIRAVFDTTDLYQGYLTPDGRLLDANPTAMAGIGRAREEVVGALFWETPWFTTTPGMSEAVREGVRAAAGGEVVRREMTLALPAGARTFDFALRPVRDADGGVAGIVAEAVDVTERRLAEEGLRQAQKMEAVGQLTGGVAHDFNNMLMIIGGSLEALARRLPHDPRTERLLDAARQGVRRGARLNEQLLAFARRQDLRPEAVRADRLLEAFGPLLRRALGETARVVVEAPADLWACRADPNQLEVALLNLAINARDAMPGGGTVAVRAANAALDAAGAEALPGAAPGDFVRIEVADDGHGMDAATAARAFEPFFTTKGVGKGTGLGLSQVYGFVKQSGGFVAVTSAPGEGTSVRLHLPRDRGGPAPAVAEPPAGPADAPRALDVLVVEDDASVREAVSLMLEDLGHRVRAAPDAAGALAALEEGPPDVVLSDVVMPGGGGVALAREVRRRFPGTPVLLTSGYTDQQLAQEGAPARAVLRKPYDREALARAIAAAARPGGN